MANLLDMAKKAANKLSDEINKNKWDSNSINQALFTSDSDHNNVPPNPASMRPAFAQPAPVNTAAAPAGSAPAPIPAVTRNSVVAAAPVPAPMPAPTAAPVSTPTPIPAPTAAPAAAQPAGGYTKPVFRSRFAGPVYSTSKVQQQSTVSSIDALPTVDQSQKISNIGKTPEEILAEEQAAAQAAPLAAPIAAGAAYCYIVHITHTKTSPEIGKQVMIRSCDHEYVWMDDQGEEKKPAYQTCPRCGKESRITSIEMD